MAPNDPAAPEGQPRMDSDHVVYRYTRRQALDDGVLVDLTQWARETGFTIPVACTAPVWHQHITPPEGTEQLGQSVRGRAHDLLWMLFVAIRRQPGAADRVWFDVIFLNQQRQHQTVRLKALCGPGDDGQPVLTVMGQGED